MGHNLGMRHDFKRKDSKGKNCYGYMDYTDSTNYWSTCSVEDFTKTKKSCLYSGPEPPVDPTCKNVPSYVKHCEKFKWACTDSRYPYFRENCKKTCNACNDYWGKLERKSLEIGKSRNILLHFWGICKYIPIPISISRYCSYCLFPEGEPLLEDQNSTGKNINWHPFVFLTLETYQNSNTSNLFSNKQQVK